MVFYSYYSTHFAMFYLCSIFFFFKQKTAYELRISDWSSDVCSSDLQEQRQRAGGAVHPGFQLAPGGGPVGVDEPVAEARVEGVVAREPFARAGVAPEVDDVSGGGGHGGSGSGGSPESNVVASSPSCEAGEGWVEEMGRAHV